MVNGVKIAAHAARPYFLVEGARTMSANDWLNVPSLVGSALGATLFGWLGAYVAVKGKNFATRQDVEFLRTDLRTNAEIMKSVDQRFSRSDVLWRSELAFRQQQLAELYGPVYGILTSQEDIYDLWMGGDMDEKNLEVKKLLSHQNAKIRELLMTKTHLIEGYAMPDSFVRFITSTVIFDLYAANTNEGEVPFYLKSDTRSAYPREFNEHVISVTEALKARIGSLNTEYAPPLELVDRSAERGEARERRNLRRGPA
jgi:hypothetical protein